MPRVRKSGIGVGEKIMIIDYVHKDIRAIDP